MVVSMLEWFMIQLKAAKARRKTVPFAACETGFLPRMMAPEYSRVANRNLQAYYTQRPKQNFGSIGSLMEISLFR